MKHRIPSPLASSFLMQAAACFWFVIVNAFAGNAQVGQPFVANFPPSDYHSSSYTSSPNNYCVIQDRLGTIYLANGNVSLFYKGKRWMPISGTEEKEFSKMAVGKNGRIFTGGVHDLGWFEPDSLGGLAFVSLIEKVSPEALDFEKIFNVTSDKKGNVFFLDKKWLFRWDGDSLQCWKSKHAFRKSLDVNGMVYVQSKDDGLWTFENGFAEKMVGSESLDSLSLRGIHMARNSKDKRFFFTYNQGLFVADGNGLKKLASPLDSFLIWNTVQVTDRLIALATSSHGLVLFDLVSREHARINEKQGLFTNSTVFPNLDAEGGIWLAALLGTSRVTHPFSLQKITSDGNPRLLVLLMLRFEEKLFIGTVNGCWVFQKGKGKEQYGLSKLSGMADIVSALVSFGDELLIGSPTDGVVRIKDDRQTKISEYGATAFCRSVVEPNRLYLGTEEGLFSLLHKGEQWLDEGQVKGVDHAIHHIAELPNGDLWASFTEVSRIQFKNGIVSDTIVTHFDSTQGFTQDHTEFEMLVHEGKLIFGTNRGIFQFDDKQQKLLPARQFGERFSDKGLAARPLVQDLLGQIWLYDGTRTGFLRRDQNGQWQWNDLPLRRMEDQEVWCIYPSPDSLIWIGTTTTLYCYDPRIPKDYHVPYHTLIDRVTVNDTQVVFYGNYADANGLLTDIQPDNYKLTFPYERNNIAFSYTATSYEYPEKTVFSHWLKGLEDDWSPWGPESDKAYNDLPEGTYTFHARSKNLYDTLGKEAAYTFTILPPWYRTWWAYVLYACAAIGMVVLIVRWQVGRANRKQEAARELERQQQRAILQTTVETQESERIRIARDLHDEVGALLSTVKMSLKLSQRKLAKDGVETSLDESTEMLDSAIGSVRQISHDLLPPSLESLGICAALAQLATKTAQLSGIPFECVLIHEPPRLEIRTELTLYRVVQELISNSLKHSQATERRLDFSFRDSVFTLVFRDNGIGFDLAKVKESGAGLGLRGMESRVDALGGKLRFETAPGQGFVAEISLRV